MKNLRYRACSLCIIKRRESILLEQFPEEDGIITFRPVGGTIEYGEDSKSAVIREVKEEINIDIIEPKLIGIIEHIFPWYGEIGHEYDFIYEGKFSLKSVARHIGNAVPPRLGEVIGESIFIAYRK